MSRMSFLRLMRLRRKRNNSAAEISVATEKIIIDDY
jgi:hypothetical protein